MTVETKIILSVLLVTILLAGLAVFIFINKKGGFGNIKKKDKEGRKSPQFHTDMKEIEKKHENKG